MSLDFHFINVGKGSCTIIEFPSGHLTVVDIDDSRSVSIEDKAFLEKLEKAKPNSPIDYIMHNFSSKEIFRFILTHPDMDHMSGIKSLFEKKKVRNFWHVPESKPDPGNWGNSPYNKEDWDFYQSLKKGSIRDVTVINPTRDDVAECCWAQDGIHILAPDDKLINRAEDLGEYDVLSYVHQIDFKGIKTMLTGDATKESLDDIVGSYNVSNLHSDILLAPGHGSKNHVSKDFLDAVKPRLTIVSVAVGVDFDHDTYSKYGRVLSTKHYGNVRVRIKDNNEIIFRTQFQKYSDGWYVLKQREDYYNST